MNKFSRYPPNLYWTSPVPTTKSPSSWLCPEHQFEIVGGNIVEYKKVIVHEFFVDNEDIIVASAQHFYDWENSEAGQWIINHAVEQPVWHKYENINLFGAKIYIVAKLKDKDLTFWQLKWGK